MAISQVQGKCQYFAHLTQEAYKCTFKTGRKHYPGRLEERTLKSRRNMASKVLLILCLVALFTPLWSLPLLMQNGKM